MRPLLPLMLVAALSLTGCVSARETPAPLADSEMQRVLEERLDAAWANTGLDGIVERPVRDPTTLVERYQSIDNFRDLFACLREQGVENFGIEERDGGPVFVASGGSPAEPLEQQIWYGCFADHPTDSSYSGVMLSEAETDYLYDYYQQWMVPCLRLKGYEFSFVPTREQFGGAMYQGWVPYYYLSSGPGFDYQVGLDENAMREMVELCGDPFPGLDYGARYGF